MLAQLNRVSPSPNQPVYMVGDSSFSSSSSSSMSSPPPSIQPTTPTTNYPVYQMISMTPPSGNPIRYTTAMTGGGGNGGFEATTPSVYRTPASMNSTPGFHQYVRYQGCASGVAASLAALSVNEADSLTTAQSQQDENSHSLSKSFSFMESTINMPTGGSSADSFSDECNSDDYYYVNKRNRIVATSISKTNLYIRGLTESTTDQDLFEMCKRYGEIKSTKAIVDKQTNKCKGYGFVDFRREEDAKSALAEMKKEQRDVQLAKQREQDPTNLYFANLPGDIDEACLSSLLKTRFGANVYSTRVMREKSGESKGVGFARIDDSKLCDKIIQELNGRPFPDHENKTKIIMVKLADSCMTIRPPKHQHHQSSKQLPNSDSSHSSTLSQNVVIDSTGVQNVVVNSTSGFVNGAEMICVREARSQPTVRSTGYYSPFSATGQNQVVPTHHPVQHSYIDYNYGAYGQIVVDNQTPSSGQSNGAGPTQPQLIPVIHPYSPTLPAYMGSPITYGTTPTGPSTRTYIQSAPTGTTVIHPGSHFSAAPLIHNHHPPNCHFYPGQTGCVPMPSIHNQQQPPPPFYIVSPHSCQHLGCNQYQYQAGPQSALEPPADSQPLTDSSQITKKF